jgi:PTH1 family peptidyl-tRNA hydrolase
LGTGENLLAITGNGLEKTRSPQFYVLVGLGNPGREYRETRHNVGFMAIDLLCEIFGIRLSRMQSKALIGQGILGENRVVLAKPQTFMNLSGQAVASLLRFYKIPIENLLVIHDDIDLPLGMLRMRPGGGSGGQKGLASTIQQLGTEDFPRLRIGIGRPSGQKAAATYVLHGFSAHEQPDLKMVLERAGEAAQIFIKEGLQSAMNRYNGTIDKE